MPSPLELQLPEPGSPPPAADEILSRFVGAATAQGIELYPAQEEAILELLAGKHVVLATPTGSGKSLVAQALHFSSLCRGQISVCTAEVLMNRVLRDPKLRADSVVMDEFHYYADKERGVAWQLPLLALPSTQFLLMSATLGDTSG